jgi:hypothetical protein
VQKVRPPAYPVSHHRAGAVLLFATSLYVQVKAPFRHDRKPRADLAVYAVRAASIVLPEPPLPARRSGDFYV